MATVSVRYIVDDVDAAIAFYCQHLGFEEQMHPAPTFAMLTRGDLRLVLSAPGAGPGGGGAPEPGDRPSVIRALRFDQFRLTSRETPGRGGRGPSEVSWKVRSSW